MDIKPSRSTLPHYPFLDTLRGLAATGVVLVHSSLASKDSGLSLLKTLAASGQRGVQLFYVVSAFTIFLSLDSRSSNEVSPTRNFFIRRFFRIAPLFYLAIILNLVFRKHSGISTHQRETPLDVALAFTFANGWNSRTISHGALGGWSIAVETTFYLIAPFLFARIRNVRQALIVLLGACATFPTASFILSYLHQSGDKDRTEYLWFLSPGIEMPIFCFGILAYFIWKARGSIAYGNQRIASLILLALAGEIFVSSGANSNKTLYWSSAAFIPLLLGLALHPWRVLVNRMTVWVGKISYSIYLLHFFLLLIISHLVSREAPFLLGTWKGTLAIFLGTLASVLVIASLSYHFIERPGIRLGKRLIVYLEARWGTWVAGSASA